MEIKLSQFMTNY